MMEEIIETQRGQAVYDLHDRVNPGALDKSIRKLIPKDLLSLKYRPNDGTLAVIEVTAAITDAYPNTLQPIEELARDFRLKVIYKKQGLEKDGGVIEINLPDDLPQSIGVRPENKADLEKCVENRLFQREPVLAVSYGNMLQEALELERLTLIGGFSIPDKTDPRYGKISDAVTEFLIEFFKLHK